MDSPMQSTFTIPDLKSRSSQILLLPLDTDVEPGNTFVNASVHDLAWSDLTVRVKDRCGEKTILDACSGHVRAGQLLALMGPSGSGKTTLLNILAARSKLDTSGQIRVNGQRINHGGMQDISGYVQQDDVNIGGLTVEESVAFTSRLANPGMSKLRRARHNDEVLRALGLSAQRATMISSPFKATLSGGQKRRLSLATALVTAPKILFLDEPTSGLDSAASYEVMTFVRKFAQTYNIAVIASIHQPSSSTMGLFDSVMLISQGRTCYFGPRDALKPHFAMIAPIPDDTNPVEFLLDVVNTDFRDHPLHCERVEAIWRAWRPPVMIERGGWLSVPRVRRAGFFGTCCVLIHRAFIKSYRDPLVYGTRLVINLALALVTGTVWLRLSYDQRSIQPFVNCLFFSAAFESLIAIAYAPAIIEDIRMLEKEHANRLYTPLPFMIANFLTGLPWLALIALAFSVLVYWLGNLQASASGFLTFCLWLFIDILAAESMIVMTAAWVPQFVTALAISAFFNGLWLAVGGFLVPISIMNAFWHYAFHFIDFQTYVFQGLMVNQFKDTVYDCDPQDTGFFCMYQSDLAAQGKIRGTAVLDQYRYDHGRQWIGWVGFSLAIVLVHRILGYIILLWRVR